MMKTSNFLLNTLLAGMVGLLCLATLLLRAFAPDYILPDLNLTLVVALTLIALVAEHYLAPRKSRAWIVTILLGAVTLGLLPFSAGLVTPVQAVELLTWGGATFAVTLGLYTCLTRRLPAGKLAPLVAALGLYLAVQCFTGIFF